MKVYFASGLKRIYGKEDCSQINRGCCMKNESFCFQTYVEAGEEVASTLRVESALTVNVYEVIAKEYEDSFEKHDDYYETPIDNSYPELLIKTQEVLLKKGEKKTFFFEIDGREKKEGEYKIDVIINGCVFPFYLKVLPLSLLETDLLITNWIHSDCISNYYQVPPFSDKFYYYFEFFLDSYVKLGNNMILLPMFTPPLDTQVGGERLTTQLLRVEKAKNAYKFDFSAAKFFIEKCKSKGIKYFELSHLFTQWGGVACPKIVVTENGEQKKLFGWETLSADAEYFHFLKQYFKALYEFLRKENLVEYTYVHLTDEPNGTQAETYQKLSNFVKENCKGLRIMEALSSYDFVQKNLVDLPVVCFQSEDLPKFHAVDKLLYYCVGVDDNYITNRYFNMPLVRSSVLGYQLYIENARGFLHWGYNFYNTQFSTKAIDPYEVFDAGGGFRPGDSFIVYPAENGVNYSIRYFAVLKAFEEYRLLKLLESKVGRQRVLDKLSELGVVGIHQYPHCAVAYENVRYELQKMLLEF